MDISIRETCFGGWNIVWSDTEASSRGRVGLDQGRAPVLVELVSLPGSCSQPCYGPQSVSWLVGWLNVVLC